MFTVALLTMAKIRNDVCPLTDEWIREKNAYIVEYYSTIKKKEILLFATTWVDPEGIMLSEIGQKEKKKDEYCTNFK